jgi:hypothetical protein
VGGHVSQIPGEGPAKDHHCSEAGDSATAAAPFAQIGQDGATAGTEQAPAPATTQAAQDTAACGKGEKASASAASAASATSAISAAAASATSAIIASAGDGGANQAKEARKASEVQGQQIQQTLDKMMPPIKKARGAPVPEKAQKDAKAPAKRKRS